MRCREEDGQRGDDGEHGENEEADAIDDHSGKLPFGDEIVFVVLLLQLGRDEAELPYDRLQVPLSLLSRNNKNTFFKSPLTFIYYYFFSALPITNGGRTRWSVSSFHLPNGLQTDSSICPPVESPQQEQHIFMLLLGCFTHSIRRRAKWTV